MFDPPPALRIEAAQEADAYVIGIEGELDVAGCADLDLALAAAERSRTGRIILDLEGLTFIDTSGLATLVRASRRSASNGSRLQITRGRGQPAELFRMTGFDKVVPLTHRPSAPQYQAMAPRG